MYLNSNQIAMANGCGFNGMKALLQAARYTEHLLVGSFPLITMWAIALNPYE
jgi:hypothetical protein